MELTTTWKEEGIQIGRQQGQQAEALNLTLRFLTRRFGPLPVEREAQISQLALGQVEQLFDAVFDFTRIEDVQQWLDTNPPDEPEANTTD